MKQFIIAEIQSFPSFIESKLRTAKALIALAGAVAIVGVVIALSGDTDRSNSRYFVSEGTALRADRVRNVTWADVDKTYLYPIYQTGQPFPSENNEDL